MNPSKTKYKAFIALVFICAPLYIVAQQNDAEFWGGITLEKELTKDLEFGLEEQIRLNNNYQHINGILSDFSIAYKPSKHLRLKANYRFGLNPEILQSTQTSHRFNFDANGRYKSKPFILYLRGRYQIGKNNVFADDTDPNPEAYLRLKAYNKFDLDKDFVPYFGFEFFYPINHPIFKATDRFRIYTGIEYDLNKFSELEAFFIYEKELNRPNPLTAYIAGIGYQISLDKISF